MSALTGVSETFDPAAWEEVPGFEGLRDTTYHRSRPGALGEGVRARAVRAAIDRPEVRNAFRPRTVDELAAVLDHARLDPSVGVVLLTGNGPSPRDGGWAFCSGGDQRVRGRTGYQYSVGDRGAVTGDGGGGDADAGSAGEGGPGDGADSSGEDGSGTGGGADAGAPGDVVDAARSAASGGRLHVLEVQRTIRTMGKVVVAVVPGWAAGGGHSLHVVCDLTIASREHARFKQTDADVGSFDAGYGSAYLARMVGQKRAREIFFLGRAYGAQEMADFGAVNLVADHDDLEAVALAVAAEVVGKSPTAQRMLKFAFNLVDDGLMGQQVFAGEATRLAYMTDEAAEGRDAFLGKRPPDFSAFPYYA